VVLTRSQEPSSDAVDLLELLLADAISFELLPMPVPLSLDLSKLGVPSGRRAIVFSSQHREGSGQRRMCGLELPLYSLFPASMIRLPMLIAALRLGITGPCLPVPPPRKVSLTWSADGQLQPSCDVAQIVAANRQAVGGPGPAMGSSEVVRLLPLRGISGKWGWCTHWWEVDPVRQTSRVFFLSWRLMSGL
jgi:hypothetical protein